MDKTPETRRIVMVNFAGLAVLILISLWAFISLSTAEIDPVTIIGTLFSFCALVYFAVMLFWNSRIYKRIREEEGSKANCYRNARIILIAAVIIPGVLILLDVALVSRHS